MRSNALLAITALGIWLTTRGQVNSNQTSSAGTVAAGIQKGDEAAILEAGSSGDSSFVPQLRALQGKPGKYVNLRVIQLALARLGQTDQLQEIRCEALFGSASVQYDAVSDKLKYVGGWFSIDSIAFLLDNANYRGARRDGRGLFQPMGIYAVRTLPAIIPNPPEISAAMMVPGSAQEMQRERAWKDWIEAHKDSLSKIAPSAAGVETSSQVCRKVLKHDRTFDHKAIKDGSGDVGVVPCPKAGCSK